MMIDEGTPRRQRSWWKEAAAATVETVKKAVDCVCAEYKPIRTALMKVLGRFPDAQAAVFEMLRAGSEGRFPLPDVG